MGKKKKCTVRNCKNFQKKDNDILFHGLPRDEEAKKRWLNAIPQHLLPENTLSIYICSMHFTPDSYELRTSGLTLEIKKMLKNTAIPTLFDHCNDTEMVGSCRCRTCLKVTDAVQCLEVTKKCYLEKSIKETILILVPEMKATIFDEDRICRTCYRVLKSSLKFVEKCLEVELTIAEENKRLEEYDNFEDLPSGQDNESEEKLGDLVKLQLDLEHNYCRKNDASSVSDRISPNLSTDIENTQQQNGSLGCDSLSLLETIKEDIVVELNDLLEESNIDNLDSAVNSLNKKEVTISSQIPSKKLSPDDYEPNVETHPEEHICEHCGKAFQSRRSYTSHQKVHDEERRMLCDICGKFIKNGLRAHMFSHRNKRPYMCHKCPKTFKTHHTCTQHEKIVHRRLNQQQCHECGTTFRTMSMCQAHYRLKHLKLTPFACHICGRKFGRKDYLQNHMHRHTAEPRPRRTAEPSPGNGKIRGGRINKTLGFRLKNPGKPVNCKICGKEISTLNNLRTHLQTHTKIKSFKCAHCGLPFTTSPNRDRHEKTHEVNQENKFRCNICWKRTKTEEELEVHLLVHKKKPPKYSCDTCGEKFYREYLLNNHCISEHLSPEDIEKAQKEIVMLNLLEYADTNI